MSKFSTFLCFLFLLINCNHTQENETKLSGEESVTHLEVKHATGFRISQLASGIKQLSVYNPWQGAENIEYKYYLAPDSTNLSKFIKNEHIIQTPIRRIISLSTTHIALIDCINETSSVVGISGADYVCNQKIRDRIDEGKIVDVGYDQNLNYELIVSLQPDLVMAFGVESNATGFANKLRSLNIPVVFNAEYLEQTPLAKAEWVKFVAAFYNKEQQASAIFDSIESNYLKTKLLLSNSDEKPTVFCNLPWKDNWYQPGGNSYVSNLIEDAGGRYLWAQDESHQSLPLSIETVFEKASNATIWINSGAANNLNQILKVDERLKQFSAYSNNQVFNNNAIQNQFGGNDYWESGLVNPHLILKDLIHIFHPGLLPNHKLIYYKQVN